MKLLDRRHFLKQGVALAGMLSAPSLFIPVARAKDEPYRTMTAATPPPGDDGRPNETSWTYFKKYIDAQDR